MGLFSKSIPDQDWLEHVEPLYKAAWPLGAALSAAIRLQPVKNEMQVLQDIYHMTGKRFPAIPGMMTIHKETLERQAKAAHAVMQKFPEIYDAVKHLPNPTSPGARQAKKNLELGLKDYADGAKQGAKLFRALAGGLGERLRRGGISTRAAAGRVAFQKTIFEEIVKKGESRMNQASNFFSKYRGSSAGRGYSMPSFLSLVSAPAVQQVSEKGLLGKPYVRLGRLFLVGGSWLYHQGGALGYGLRGHGDILGKVLGAAPSQAAEYVQSLRRTAESHLRQVEGQEKTFYQLYVVRELRALGIDLTAWPSNKALDRKCNAEMASDVMRVSFHEGAGLGFHFPDMLREYWVNTYRLRPDNEWQEMRAHRLELSDTQQERPLGTAVAELTEAAAEWARAVAPGLLSDSEISVLKRLSATAG